MQETWVRYLGLEDPLKKGMATHSSILAREQRSLVGYSPWGHKEADMTEWLPKDRDELQDEELYRVRSGRLQNVWTSVPMELEYAIIGCTHQSGSFFYPILLGILWRFYHLGETNYCVHFQLLFPLWRMRGGAENSKLPTIACSFWGPASVQECTQSPHLIRTEDTAITQEIPRDLWALCQGPGSRIKCWNTGFS